MSVGWSRRFRTRSPKFERLDAPDESIQFLGDALRAFADLATVLIVHTDVLSIDQAREHASSALSNRALIEQAKGVLSHNQAVDMADAYELPKTMATQAGKDLTAMAKDILIRAQSH